MWLEPEVRLIGEWDEAAAGSTQSRSDARRLDEGHWSLVRRSPGRRRRGPRTLPTSASGRPSSTIRTSASEPSASVPTPTPSARRRSRRAPASTTTPVSGRSTPQPPRKRCATPSWVRARARAPALSRRVSVDVEEREPVAATPTDDGTFLVDETGVLFSPEGRRESPDRTVSDRLAGRRRRRPRARDAFAHAAANRPRGRSVGDRGLRSPHRRRHASLAVPGTTACVGSARRRRPTPSGAAAACALRLRALPAGRGSCDRDRRQLPRPRGPAHVERRATRR